MGVPLTAVEQEATSIQLFLEELRSSKLVSEVEWKGCLDYEVRFHRSGQVKEVNQLIHPGWKTAFNGVTLDVLTSTNDSVELQRPSIFWEDRAIKMVVVCNGSLAEGEFDTAEFDFEVDQPLELTGLKSNTEYECEARLFKDDGSSSEWSEVWSASTQETGAEPESFPEGTSTMMESQEELDNLDDPIPRFGAHSDDDDAGLETAPAITAAPHLADASSSSSTMAPVSLTTLKNSGNLTLGSFLALTLPFTLVLLRTTTGPF